MAESEKFELQPGPALQAVGSLSEGFGKAMDYWSMAAISDLNASLLEIDAKMILADSAYAVRRAEEKGRSFVGTQKAMYAKSGVTFEGSPMKVVLESERNIRLDILMAKNNAVRRANATGFQAVQQKHAAGRARTRAVKAMGDGVINMMGTYAGAAV